MKRFGHLLVCLVLFAVMSFAVNAQAESHPAISLARYVQSVDPDTQTIITTLRAENKSETTVSCVFYTVLEQPDGLSDSCHTTKVQLSPGVNYVELSHPYTAAGDGYLMRVYCWDNAMQPYSDVLIYQMDFTPTVTGIALNQTKVQLILSQKQTFALSYTLAPSSLPDPGVTYASEDPQIAAVSAQGVITPKTPGTARIMVITKDRSAYATCEVTVISDQTKISLNQSAVILGSATQLQFQLEATVTPADAPDKTLVYTSDNSKVVTVSQTGLLKAIAKGTATVTVTTGDRQATATCKITVTDVATSIKLNKSQITIWDYGMYMLVPTVTGAENPKIQWTSSDHTIATVSDSGIVYGVAKGTAVITAAIGGQKATCTVKVYREYDYTGSIAAHFESGDNPGSISGSGTGKSYGCFQLYAGSNGPKSFYNWLISSGFNPDIGNKLKQAHQKDGGKDKTFGTNFDTAWKKLANEQAEEFRSCQMAYCMSIYYEPLVNRLVTELNFYPDNYGLALKSALWSRAIQHGTGGAFNRIRDAFASLGGFVGKTEKQLITAIYKECGAVVSSPPESGAIPMNSDSEIAVEYGLVGKYMKYYYTSSSSMQAGVWKRLNVTELNMLYDLLKKPPIVITQ